MRLSTLFRVARKACASCRYWVPDEGQEDIVLGECRIAPPQINPLRGDPDDPDTQAGLPRRPWPMTQDADWCSSWRRSLM